MCCTSSLGVFCMSAIILAQSSALVSIKHGYARFSLVCYGAQLHTPTACEQASTPSVPDVPKRSVWANDNNFREKRFATPATWPHVGLVEVKRNVGRRQLCKIEGGSFATSVERGGVGPPCAPAVPAAHSPVRGSTRHRARRAYRLPPLAARPAPRRQCYRQRSRRVARRAGRTRVACSRKSRDIFRVGIFF